MTVQMRIGDAINRARRQMNELAPHHVAGDAVFVAAILADACLHFRFHLGHCFLDRAAEGVDDPFITGDRMQQ